MTTIPSPVSEVNAFERLLREIPAHEKRQAQRISRENERIEKERTLRFFLAFKQVKAVPEP
jgi:hypothetical protein